MPLHEAHVAGGYTWDPQTREAYFNDLENPHHLVAVSLSANRSKGSRRPEEWMPSNPAYHCQYLRDWINIKAKWQLALGKSEAVFIAQRLASCVP